MLPVGSEGTVRSSIQPLLSICNDVESMCSNFQTATCPLALASKMSVFQLWPTWLQTCCQAFAD